MKLESSSQFIHFLTEELQIPEESIALAMRQNLPSPDFLPMLLWQYGSIDLSQLERIFAWLDL